MRITQYIRIGVGTGGNEVQRLGEHSDELWLGVERRPFRQHFLQPRDHQVDLQVRAHSGFLPSRQASDRTAAASSPAQRAQACRPRDVHPS